MSRLWPTIGKEFRTKSNVHSRARPHQSRARIREEDTGERADIMFSDAQGEDDGPEDVEASGPDEPQHTSEPHSSFADTATEQHETITEVAGGDCAKANENIKNRQEQIKALHIENTGRMQQCSKAYPRSRSSAEIIDDGDSEVSRSAASSDLCRTPRDSEFPWNICDLIQHFDAVDSMESEDETPGASRNTSSSFKIKSTYDINSVRALFERGGAQLTDSHKGAHEQSTPTDRSTPLAARTRTQAKNGRSVMGKRSPTRVNEACASEVTNAGIQEDASPNSVPTPPTSSKTPMRKMPPETSFASPITPSVSPSLTPGSTEKFFLPRTICDEEDIGEDEIKPQNATIISAVSFSKTVKVVPVPQQAADGFDSTTSSEKTNLKDLFDSMQLSPRASRANSTNRHKKGEPIGVVQSPVHIAAEHTMFDENESVTFCDSPYGELAQRPRRDTTLSNSEARTASRAKSFAHVSNGDRRRPGAAIARAVKRTTRLHVERNRSSTGTGSNGRTAKGRGSVTTPRLTRRGSAASVSAGCSSTAATTSARRSSVTTPASTRRGSVATAVPTRRGSTAATMSPQRNQGVLGTSRNIVAGAVDSARRDMNTGEGPRIARRARTQTQRVKRQMDVFRGIISGDGLY